MKEREEWIKQYHRERYEKKKLLRSEVVRKGVDEQNDF